MCWIIDLCTISLAHVDTHLNTITLYVPNLGDIDEEVMKETTHDVNELIKHSITNTVFKECIAKDACNVVENLDTPLHNCVNVDSFTCQKFKTLLKN